MIYAFEYPHKVGTVCGPGCQLCDPEGPKPWSYMTDQDGNHIPLQPLFIIREVTFQDHVADLEASGGMAFPTAGKYYYEVSTD